MGDRDRLGHGPRFPGNETTSRNGDSVNYRSLMFVRCQCGNDWADVIDSGDDWAEIACDHCGEMWFADSENPPSISQETETKNA